MGFKLMQEVIDGSLAVGAAYQVHKTLAHRAKDDTRLCRMSHVQIERETRLDRRRVYRALSSLKDLKHISSLRKGSKRGICCFTLLSRQGDTGATLSGQAVCKQGDTETTLLGQQGDTGATFSPNKVTPGPPIRQERKQERENPAELRSSGMPPLNQVADQEGAGACSTFEPTHQDRATSSPNVNTVAAPPVRDKNKSPRATLLKHTYAPLGSWFDEVNRIYPNQGKADRAKAERVVRRLKLDGQGPQILAAMQELIRSDPGWSDGGPFLKDLSVWLEGGAFMNVREKIKVRKLVI